MNGSAMRFVAFCKIACRTYVLSGRERSLAREIKETNQMRAQTTPRINTRRGFAQRCLGAVDLAIEFATLGEYGLEPLPEHRSCRERSGRAAGWEALATARSRGCGGEVTSLRCPRVRLGDVA